MTGEIRVSDFAQSPNFSACTRCGKGVTWARNPLDANRRAGQWHTPLEYVGAAYTILDGVVRWIPTYHAHECADADVEAHNQQRYALNAARKAAGADQAASDRLRLIGEALKVSCTACKAPVGRMCTNLTKAKLGTETKWPHNPRLILAGVAPAEWRT